MTSASSSASYFGIFDDATLKTAKLNTEKLFWGASGLVNFPINFFTQGLADFLGLETLRHGTSWSNYISIRMNGPDPSYGGKETGATFGNIVAKTGNTADQRGYMRHSSGRFFAFLDSKAGCDTTYTDEDGKTKTISFAWYWKLYYQVHVRVAPHTYGFGSGAACALPKDVDGILATIWRFFCGILSFFAPTVKLRFRPEDVYLYFQNDYKLPGRAVFTTQPIGTDHLGITGIFKQAVEGNLWQRIQANPSRTAWGLARLANPVGMVLLASFGIYYAYKHRNPDTLPSAAKVSS